MLIRKNEKQADYWKNFFQTVFANLEEVLIAADVDMDRLEYISPNAERLLGIRQEEQASAGYLLRQIGLAESCDLTVFKRKDSGEEERYLINVQTGGELWCRCCWSFLRAFPNEEEKIIINISDRSKERASMDRIRQDLQEAERSNAAKSRFLTTISHDMRTPMNAIMGLTDLAMEHMEEQEKVQEYLYKIARSSTHLLELINDVLDMSRIESGKMALEHRPFDLKELLEDVMDIIRPQAEAKMQAVETNWSLIYPQVIGDPVRIRQVLINLLSNGVKYTQRGGRIVFQLSQCRGEAQRESGAQGELRIQIYDNGYGMSETFQQIIFEPFAKENAEHAQEIEGTGLGMSITKSLVDLMGGNLSVESRLGEGSNFTVDIPLELQYDDKAQEGEKSEKDVQGFDCGGYRILLVEDNEMTADVLTDILELMGAEVEWAGNGEQALEVFAGGPAHTFDVVLMDVQMPVMDGYEATRRLRSLSEEGRNVPIVALTGNAFTEDIQASRAAGMDHHLTKPVKKKDLEAVLRQVLGARRAKVKRG